MGTSKQIHLSIPTPCHEKWGEMSPTEKGRFCGSCKKEVVDFSGYTDEQIIEHFAASSSNTCGRFYRTQIDRKIKQSRKVKRPRVFHFLFGSFLALFSSKFSLAQNKSAMDQIEQTELIPATKTEALETKKHRPIVLRGTVFDGSSKERIIGASVVLVADPTIGCGTDIDGNFEFVVPDEYESDKVEIKVMSIGYETRHLTVKNGRLPDRIELEITSVMLGEYVVVGAVCTHPKDSKMETFQVKQWLKSLGHW